MAKLNIDEIDIDDLEETFLSILPDGKRDEYTQLGTEGERVDFIIKLIENSYLPFFDNDMEMEALLDEIGILAGVLDVDNELTGDLVNAFVGLATYVRVDDTHVQIKDRLLVIITYTMELLD